MSDRVNNAIALFDEGFVCSQSVVGAYSEMVGLDKESALKISNGFGGGIARRQEICGAVSGAIMLIGMKYGKSDSQDQAAYEKAYRLINQLCDRFIDKHRSIHCHELLGCDLAAAGQKGLFTTSCRKYVQDCAEMIEDLMKECTT
jgi:C_GCAxxG_C_C family probable redox protein